MAGLLADLVEQVGDAGVGEVVGLGDLQGEAGLRVTTDGFDWQVPGYRRALVDALVRTLPKDVRRTLIPMAETVGRRVGSTRVPVGEG